MLDWYWFKNSLFVELGVTNALCLAVENVDTREALEIALCHATRDFSISSRAW
jgi:hypothetical protein